MTKTKKRNIAMVILLAMLICVAMLGVGVVHFSTTSNAYAAEFNRVEMHSEQRVANSARSVEIFAEVMPSLRTEVTNVGGESEFIYDDNFAGIFIDENGILNIATVASGFSTMSFSANQFGEQVIQRHFTYSYNHLLSIKDIVFPMMYTHGIFTISIDEINNRVSIYMTDNIYRSIVVEKLQRNGVYSTTSLNFVINPYAENFLDSRAIQGGDSIFRQDDDGGWWRGTIGAQAICNTTGQVGVLTNEHVIAQLRQDVAHHTAGANRIGLVTRGEIGTNIDASFIIFENQNNWIHSPHARNFHRDDNNRREDFTNIRLGTESQIVSGASIKRFGGTTGITTGTIDSRNTSMSFSWEGSSRTMSNSFRYTNDGEGGDSGGPVYVQSGNGLYLIGLHFGSGNGGFLWLQRFGYASRITNVMTALDVTPITNCLFQPTINGNGVQVNNIGWHLPSSVTSLTIPDILDNRNVTHVAAGALPHHQRITVNLPATVTNIGNNAFCVTATVRWAGRHVTRGNTFVQCLRPNNVVNIPVPNTIAGHTITQVAADAFTHRTQALNITLPITTAIVSNNAFPLNATVTWLGRYRFRGHEFLRCYRSYRETDIQIPATIAGRAITTIADGAFFARSHVTRITIPANVSVIGTSAFNDSSVANFAVAATNPHFSSNSGVLFNRSQNTLVRYPHGNTRNSFIIPNTVTRIERGAFVNARNLTSLTVSRTASAGITNLSANVFDNINSSLRIYVPACSLVAYRNAIFWSAPAIQNRIHALAPPSEIWIDCFFVCCCVGYSRHISLAPTQTAMASAAFGATGYFSIQISRMAGGSSSGGGNFSFKIDNTRGVILVYMLDGPPSSPTTQTHFMQAWSSKQFIFANYTPYNLLININISWCWWSN